MEQEQRGKTRAFYGEGVLANLSDRLTSEFGKGFDLTNLRKMRQFYLTFPKRDAVRLEFGRGFDKRNLWYMRSFYQSFPIMNALRSQF